MHVVKFEYMYTFSLLQLYNRRAMGLVDMNPMSVEFYMDKNVNDVPDKILKPIRSELNVGAAWKALIDTAGDLRPNYKMRLL